MGIIGRRQIHNTAHWRCGTWDGCVKMGTGVPQVSMVSTDEFLETEHGTGFPRHYDFSLKPNMEA